MSTKVNTDADSSASDSPKKATAPRKKATPRTPKKLMDKISEANGIVEANADKASSAPSGWAPLANPDAEAAGAVLAAAGALNGTTLHGWAPGYTEADFQTSGVLARDFMRGRGPVPEQPVSKAWDNSELMALAARFWNLTPGLQMTALAADSRGVARIPLLATMMPLIVQTIPWYVRLPDALGDMTNPEGGISLNWYTALVAVPGTGKTTTANLAKALIRVPRGMQMHVVPEGTAEGLVKEFTFTVEKKDKDRLDKDGMPTVTRVTKIAARHAYMHADEATAVNEELTRKGSKFSSSIRKMWYGELTGSTTGSLESRTKLTEHSYRFSMHANLPTEFVVAFFDEISAGTPQRFYWAISARSQRDDSIGTVPPIKVAEWGKPKPMPDAWAENPEPILGDSPTVWMDWAPAARAEFEAQAAEDWDRNPLDEGDSVEDAFEKSLTDHRRTGEQKAAAIFAVLDGLHQPEDVHWEAAKIWYDMREVSMRMIKAAADKAGSVRRAEEGTRKGEVQGAANLSAKGYTAQTLMDVQQRIVQLLSRKPMTESALYRSITSSKRGAVGDAIAQLSEQGLITRDAAGTYSLVKL